MGLFALCPQCVRMYGFCGVLEVLYASRQWIPRTESAVEKILDAIRRVLNLKKSKWRCSQLQNRGVPSHLNAVAYCTLSVQSRATQEKIGWTVATAVAV